MVKMFDTEVHLSSLNLTLDLSIHFLSVYFEIPQDI